MFPETAEQVRNEMFDLETSIIKKSENMENEIDAIRKMVDNSEAETEIRDAFIGTNKTQKA